MDELLGKNLQDFEIVDFDIDLLGESKVIKTQTDHTTLEAVDQNSKSVFLRSYRPTSQSTLDGLRS